MATTLFRFAACAILTSALLAAGARNVAAAGDYVTFKIWNDTHVAIAQLYDKDSRQDAWGINDVQDVGSGANPLAGTIHPVQPGHYFYIRLEQNSYAHCPTMLHDVKLVFSNGDVKIIRKIEICKYDVHVNRT